MTNLTNPLGLKKHFQAPNYKLNLIPLVDVLFIAFLLTLLGSHFVFSPGLSIDLPKASQQLLPGTSSTAILTIKQSNMLFYEGNIYTLDTIEPALKQSLSKTKSPTPVLLVKMSQNSELGTLFKICELAKNAGFAHLQIAGNFTQNNPQEVYNLLEINKL